MVFKIKLDMDGRVHIHKAQLVSRWYLKVKIHGIDYDEIFFTCRDV